MFRLKTVGESGRARRWTVISGVLIALGLASALGGAVAAGALGSGHSKMRALSPTQPGSVITLSSVSNARLLKFANGVTLTVPSKADSSAASVSQAQANSAAVTAFPADNGATKSYPLDTVLASVSAPGDVVLNGNTFWVVSLGPQGHFPAPSGGGMGRFKLVFVNPQTGKWVTSISGS